MVDGCSGGDEVLTGVGESNKKKWLQEDATALPHPVTLE